MQIKFTTLTASYHESADAVTATVDRVFDEQTDATERFYIDLGFSSRRYEIRADDYAGDASTVYMSRILAAFVEAFDERYMTIEHACSPADALQEPLEFTVEH